MKSTADDHVFLNFIDHGAPGLIAFPDTELHKEKLQDTFKAMRSDGKFGKLVFYLETCYSGSMFEDMNVSGVYAVSAANPRESSYGTFCGADAVVNGKNLNTCLGDLFSVNWMQDVTSKDTTSETLQQQYETVQDQTYRSHVLQWGDKSFLSDTLSSFIGPATGILQSTVQIKPRSNVKTEEIHLERLYSQYQRATRAKERLVVAKQLQYQSTVQYNAEAAHYRLAALAYPGDEKAQHQARVLEHPPKYPECELAGHAAIREHCADKFDANDGYALRYHQVVVNICNDIAEIGLNLDIRGAAENACGKAPTTVVV